MGRSEWPTHGLWRVERDEFESAVIGEILNGRCRPVVMTDISPLWNDYTGPGAPHHNFKRAAMSRRRERVNDMRSAGLTYQNISARLGVSCGTVYSDANHNRYATCAQPPSSHERTDDGYLD